MKRLLLLLAFTVIGLQVMAQSDDNEYNYFEVARNIAKPVTIETNLGTFEIYGGEVIEGHISRCTPRDANGNLIVNNQAYKTEWSTDRNKPTKKYWRFSDTYKEHSVLDDEKKSSSSSSGSGESWGTDLANSLNRYADKASKIECYGYSNFQVRAGWSLHFGEMLSAKAEMGGVGGYMLIGGIGKNYFLANPERRISWYAGLGYYGGSADGHDISFGIIFGRNQVYDGYMLGMELQYSHFFRNAPWFGYYLGAGWGIYVDYNTYNLVGDVHAGLSLRLFDDYKAEERERANGEVTMPSQYEIDQFFNSPALYLGIDGRLAANWTVWNYPREGSPWRAFGRPLQYECYVEYFSRKKLFYDSNNNKAKPSICGWGMAVAYMRRGGANTTLYDGTAIYNMTYICLRPAFAARWYKKYIKEDAVLHVGPELGILTDAEMLISGQPMDISNGCAPYTYGGFFEVKARLWKNITLGGFMEFSFPVFKNMDVSANFALGVTLGWESNAIKL